MYTHKFTNYCKKEVKLEYIVREITSGLCTNFLKPL